MKKKNKNGTFESAYFYWPNLNHCGEKLESLRDMRICHLNDLKKFSNQKSFKLIITVRDFEKK